MRRPATSSLMGNKATETKEVVEQDAGDGMNVKDLKIVVPECDLYELREDRKYLLITSLDSMSKNFIERFKNELPPDTLIVQVRGTSSDAVALIEMQVSI